MVQDALRRAKDVIKPSKALRSLLEGYDIGRSSVIGWRLSARDRQKLKAVVESQEGLDLSAAVLDGSRLELAEQGAFNEKLGNVRPLRSRVVCMALGGPLHLRQGHLQSFGSVEFRVELSDILIDPYAALLVIENHHAFVEVRRLNLSLTGSMLVVYRGHDDSAHAAREIIRLAAETGKPVIWCSDGDPAGIGLTLGSGASHALIPAEAWRQAQHTMGDSQTAAQQLAERPALLESVRSDAGLTDEYRSYAEWVLSGRCFSEEFWLSQRVPLEPVIIRR